LTFSSHRVFRVSVAKFVLGDGKYALVSMNTIEFLPAAI